MEGTHCARCSKKFDDPEEAIPTILPGESRLQLTCWDDRTCYMEEMFLANFVSKKTRKVGDINKRFAVF